MRRILLTVVLLLMIAMMSACTFADDSVNLGNDTYGTQNVEILFENGFENKDVIVALYGSNKLIDVHLIEDFTLTGNRLFVNAGSLDESDTVKAYVLNSFEDVQPHCKPASALIESGDMLPDEESYFVIDALGMGYLFDNGRFALPSGWISYNKNLGNITNGVQNCCVSDESDDDYSALYRDFDKISSGNILLEFFGYIVSENDGIYIGFADESENVICSLSTDNGKFVLKGKTDLVTNVDVSAKELTDYAVFLNINLDKKQLSACIDGIYTKTVELPDDIALSRLILGSTLSGTGYMLPKHVRMYNNYAMAERFLVTDKMSGKQPSSMNIRGNVTLEEYQTVSTDDKYSAKINAKAESINVASRGFSGVSGKGVFETYILLPDGADGAFFSITCSDKNVVKISSKDGAWYVDDVKMRDFTPNVWQTLRIETDNTTGKAVIKICGKTMGEVPILAQYIDGVKIGIVPDVDTVMWFDDIVAYKSVEHENYPSEPIANNDDGYNIGVNVCNLWHDANTKEGWQSVSPFAELEPWLGFYDEGSPELADWEIKIMAEHGIDFQHFCWYQPQPVISHPIKTINKSAPAIHDGYFNAKYSDKVKFCIMWENAITKKSTFANFKEYIWSYWKEYYFSDSRYMTLDNKPILTIWGYDFFRDFFGGVKEAKEAVDFMREDIKTLGFDGLIFLVKSSKNPSEIGADAGYFYHYSQDGYSADYQINKLEEYKTSEFHAIPTLAMGHNGIGRYDYRVPIATMEDHKRVAEYIKNDYLASRNTGTWMDNTLFVSTWNEYSEGHYICPSGEFGYGYLENIKNVFTNDNSDHTSVDVKPTESQKDRITKMYPNTYQPIRILRNETEAIEMMPIAKWDFSNDKHVKLWSFNNIEVDEKTQNGLKMHGTTTDPQIYKYNTNVSLQKKPVLHIRMKTDNACNIWVYFTTEESHKLGDGIKELSVPIKSSGEMVDYYIDMSVINEWSGTLSTLRIDPVSHTESFEIELVELLVPKSSSEVILAEWDFSDENTVKEWGVDNKYNTTMIFEGCNDTGMVAHGTTKDPQLYKYELNLDISQKPSIHFRMKTSSNTYAQIFYKTDNDTGLNESRSKRIPLEATGESVDYYIDMTDVSSWDSILKTLRFDPCNDDTNFELEYLKIFIPQYDDGKVFVNGNEMTFNFRTIAKYEDVEVTTNPDLGFFTMLNLYHTWNRYTGKLYVESDNHSLEFTVGSDKVLVDGVEQNLGYTFTLRDGLPVVKIKDFCEMLGFEVVVNGNNFYINTGRTPIITEKDNYYGWEFNTNGNTEGWYSYDSVVYSYDGKLCSENPTHFDMHLFPQEVKIDSTMYKKLAVGIYVDPEDVKETFFQMFFKAGKQTLDEDKSFKHKYDTSVMSNGQIYEFEIDLTQNKYWLGMINDLRIDVCDAEVEYSIDYIRFTN